VLSENISKRICGEAIFIQIGEFAFDERLILVLKDPNRLGNKSIKFVR